MDCIVLFERVWRAEFNLVGMSLEYWMESLDYGDEGGFLSL